METFNQLISESGFPVYYRLTASDGNEMQRVFRLAGDFRVGQRVENGVLILEVEGPFDVLHASLVKDVLTERLKVASACGIQYVGVDCDLSKVSVIDSAAVGVLVVARTMLPRAPFRLFGLTPTRKSMFQPLGIFDLVDEPVPETEMAVSV